VKYDGQFLNDFYEGEGKLYALDESLIYDGLWKGGLYHSKGKIFLENGIVYYEGDFDSGVSFFFLVNLIERFSLGMEKWILRMESCNTRASFPGASTTDKARCIAQQGSFFTLVDSLTGCMMGSAKFTWRTGVSIMRANSARALNRDKVFIMTARATSGIKGCSGMEML
jgi:hypothetical protein